MTIFSAKWLLLIVTCAYQSSYGQRRVVTIGRKLVDTHLVFIVDYTHLTHEHVESLYKFCVPLVKGFRNTSVEMQIDGLRMNGVKLSSYRSSLCKSIFATEQKRSRGQRNGTSVNYPVIRMIRWYAGALKKAKELFSMGTDRRKVGVLITHGKEGCTPNTTGCKNCCKNCADCDNGPCKKRIDGHKFQLFVTNQAEQLKKKSVKLVTISVGDNTDPERLKCWASAGMFISVKSYDELSVSGATRVLNLVKETKNPTTTKGPTATITSTTTTTATPTTTRTIRTIWHRGESTTPEKSVTTTIITPLKRTTVLTRLTVATTATVTSSLVTTDSMPIDSTYSSTAQSTTEKIEAAGKENDKPSIFWLTVAGCLFALTTLILAVVITAVLLRRWIMKRRKRLTDTKENKKKKPKVRHSTAFPKQRQQQRFVKGMDSTRSPPTTHIEGLSNFKPLPSEIYKSKGSSVSEDSLLLPRRPEAIIIGRGPCPRPTISNSKHTMSGGRLMKPK